MSDPWGRGVLLAAAAAPLLLAVAPAEAAPPRPPVASLHVAKTDPGGQPLAGATFEIHDQPGGPVVATVTTRPPDGTADVALRPGTYCLVEVAVPPGFQLAPTFTPASGCVTIGAGPGPRTVTAVDPPVQAASGVLRVVKTDPSGATVTVAGAGFRVHSGTPGGPVVAMLTTGGSGTASAGGLAPGTYCVEETVAPPGFQVAPQFTPAQCVAVVGGGTAIVSVADPPVAAGPGPTPAPTSSPSPTPTRGPTGELLVVKTDTAGKGVTTPGFTFNVRVGAANGPVVATITTDGGGTAVAAALNPATYCVEETAAPDGYQMAPTYTPGACVAVAADLTQGRSPTTVTVSDPATATATPSPAGGAAGGQQSRPRGGGRLAPPVRAAAANLAGALAAPALISTGLLLLALGAVMVAIGLRRRRLAPAYEPPSTTYDSTIT